MKLEFAMLGYDACEHGIALGTISDCAYMHRRCAFIFLKLLLKFFPTCSDQMLIAYEWLQKEDKENIEERKRERERGQTFEHGAISYIRMHTHTHIKEKEKDVAIIFVYYYTCTQHTNYSELQTSRITNRK